MSQPFADALNWVPKTRALAATLSRAHDFARAHGHAGVGLEHLLLSLIEDPDASGVLSASGVELEGLTGDIANFLSGLPETDTDPPAADEALLRILEYAVAAAQQSKRRDVNGGIVLAAIVGEGKSEAAGILREHGMTFQAAIEAIKGASRPPAAAPRAPVPMPVEPAPPSPDQEYDQGEFSDAATSATEVLLARARQRVDALQTPVPVVTRTVTAPPAPPAPPAATKPEPEIATPLEPPDSPAVAPPAVPGAVPPPPPPVPAPVHDDPPPKPAPSWLPPSPPSAEIGAAARTPARIPPPMPPLSTGTGPPPLPGSPPVNGHSGGSTDVAWSDNGAGVPFPAGSASLDDVAASIKPGPRDRKRPARGGDNRQDSADSAAAGRLLGDRLIAATPRRIVSGRSAEIEIRIPWTDLAAQIGANIMAVSLRLSVVSGSAQIETATPETAWLDASRGQPGEEAIWLWTVTPQRRGRMQLMVTGTARTVTRAGAGSEIVLAGQRVEVRATPNYVRGIGKATAVTLLAGTGALLDDYAEPALEIAMQFMTRIVGGP